MVVSALLFAGMAASVRVIAQELPNAPIVLLVVEKGELVLTR